MKNLWKDADVAGFFPDALKLRVYTSKLIGSEPDLVLHGGGNTSVKAIAKDFFGNDVETLYVKGSGHALDTITESGFAPVRMDALLQHDLRPGDRRRKRSFAWCRRGARVRPAGGSQHAGRDSCLQDG